MNKIINVNLLKHPMNWIVILMMLLIAGFAGHLVLSYFGSEPSGNGLGASMANAGLAQS